MENQQWSGGSSIKMKNSRLPMINHDLRERLKRASYFYHGKKWGKLKEDLENAILQLLENGYLSDADKETQKHRGELPAIPHEGSIYKELTSTDDQKKLTEMEFFNEFDIGPIYFKDKVTTDYLKRIVKKITSK